MGYKIVVSPRAQKEIENAMDYYALYSTNTPILFIAALKETYRQMETNPLFAVRYKNIRSLKIDKFPHSLYFVVEENTVRVLSCFHNKRNPRRRPKQG